MVFSLLWFLLLLRIVATEVCEDGGARSCDDCVRLHPDCIWLVEPQGNSRCINENNKPTGPTTVKYGGRTTVTNVRDDEFRLPSADQPAVQIRPQKIRMRLRHGEPVNFQLRYKALSDYPLDIYYLVDQTNTMRAHVTELRNVSFTLADDLGKLTKNYQIAFGYYSDKMLMPYNSMVPKFLANPCAKNANEKCAPGSNFVHALNFTNDTDAFFAQVNKLFEQFTANLDNLEGGLDALLQILVCDSFGWRMYSRKIVLIATDGLLHTAGDGILGGAVQRAPAKCIMRHQSDGRLAYDDLLNDYPSVEEIYRLLMAKKMALLLAIEQNEDNSEYYTSLNNLLYEVSSLVMHQADQTVNISSVLEAGFFDAVKKVKFNVIDKPSYLQFEASTFCDGKLKNNSWSCWDVTLDKEYIFNITVTLTELPPVKHNVIRIEEKHLHEVLEIEVEYAETCSCEDRIEATNSLLHGTYKCGVNICDLGWVGEFCDEECDPSKKRYSSKSSVTCSGNGDFDIGLCQCNCDKEYAGEFCQTRCGLNNKGAVCSNNGVCTEKGCICYDGFDGEICDCVQSNKTCIRKHSDVICEGHGTCKCGICNCFSRHAAINYTGTYCERCSGCNDCPFNDAVNKHVINRLDAVEQAHFLFIETSNDTELQCRSLYSPNSTHECTVDYTHEDNKVIVIKYYNKCTAIAALSYAQIGEKMTMIIGPIIVLGLIALLSWKAVVTIKDKRETAKFEAQTKSATFEFNKMYESPIRNYENPLHNQD